MANAFTGGASGAAWDLLVETAYNREADFYLRDMPQWRQLIDKTPTRLAMPGDTVTLTLHNTALSLATTPLTETVDPDAVAMPAPSRVNVTINEYGNPALHTLRLEKLAFIAPDPAIVEHLSRNMQDSIDQIIRSVADAGTNILWVNGGVSKTTGGADASVTTTDVLKRDPATLAVKLLQRAKVDPKQAGYYVSVIHPDVAFDLQAENSATAWTAPHVYGTDTSNIYSGVVGDFQGARYMQTTRCTKTATGAGSIGVYSTYYFGREALVEVPVVEPHIVVGPQTDKLKRFFPIGWHAMAGWAIYRPQALVTVKTTSSMQGL